MQLWMIATIFLAFALSATGVFLCISFAWRWGVLDMPQLPKKHHTLPTPLLGGVAPFLVFLILFFGIEGVTGFFSSGALSPRTLAGFGVALLVLLVGGVLDDLTPLSPRFSFLFPLVAACVAVGTGMGVSKVTNPFGDPFILLPVMSLVITLVWLLCVTYTTKLLDGVDGLASSVGLVGFLMIGALASTARWYQPDIALLAFLLFATTLGFFVWNAPRARIFLGEAGSTMIGFSLGALAVMGGSKFATLLLVVALPALDVLFVAVRRIQQGRSPFVGGDGLHLHTTLLHRGWKAKYVVAFYLFTALLFGCTTLFFTSWQKLLVLSALAFGALIFFLYITPKSHS